MRNMLKDPCIVVGCPRNRTSLVMQILHICGANLGKVIGQTKANPYGAGQLENRAIVDQVQKPWLKKHGFDPKGQYPLPPPDFAEVDPQRRSQVERILQEQGFITERPFFKQLKATLDWVAWDYSFPEATWIIVRRNDESVINSCMSPKAPFMSAFNTVKDWQWWIDEHKTRLDQIKNYCHSVYEIDTDKIVDEDLSQVEPVIEELNLTWKPKDIRQNLA